VAISNLTRVLHQAVVVDVFSNPALLSDKQKNIIKNKVGNHTFCDKMPRNAISAIRLDADGTASLDNKPVIFYPFFSGHLAMPIKPGERVFIIYENANAPNEPVGADILGYWITRVSANINIDDLNYTCQERTPPITAKDQIRQIIDGTAVEDVPGFPNGTSVEGRVLKNPNGFEEIVTSAFAFRNIDDGDDVWESKVDQASPLTATEFTGEPVPRYSKVCSDLVLQGSNNTLIALTEDIAAKSEGGSTILGAGSIDIVAGRGVGSGNVVTPIANTREYEETDKKVDIATSAEGDLDFLTDLSRVYVSMKSNVDDLFGLTYAFGDDIVPPKVGVASTTVKSDEVRVVARDSGSIRLVKKSTDDASFCEVNLLSDNRIAIDAEKIYLGYDTGDTVSEVTTLATDTSGLYTSLAPGLMSSPDEGNGAGGIYTSGHGTGAEGNRAVRGDHLLHAFTVFLGSASTAISLVRGNMGGPIPGMDELMGAFIVLHSNIEASLSNSVFLK